MSNSASEEPELASSLSPALPSPFCHGSIPTREELLTPPPEIKKYLEEVRATSGSCSAAWGKYSSYPLVPVGSLPPPTFWNAKDDQSLTGTEHQHGISLCFHIHAVCGRARAATIHLRPQPGQRDDECPQVPTPIFMPVGTKGCLKGITLAELADSDALMQCPIILANTYHLAIQPGTDLIRDCQHLHAFQGCQNLPDLQFTDNATHKNRAYSLLTDSGGFQMVSLVKLSEVTEDGVTFENPFSKRRRLVRSSSPMTAEGDNTQKMDPAATYRTSLQPMSVDKTNSATDLSCDSAGGKHESERDMLLLRPEDSIRHQNNIGANIIMALDDVISSVEVDDDRFRIATYRTLRWYDRCYHAHQRSRTQNLFPIVQGALDVSPGGLREQCLAGFRHREMNLGYKIPGYAIGGLAGGETKDKFWRVVDLSCRCLPDDRPRYLMGVGYPLDLVVCTALGVDMYDCVYPTRTARFGVALVDPDCSLPPECEQSATSSGSSLGTLRLKSHECALQDDRPIQFGCRCQACLTTVGSDSSFISRSRLHRLLKAGNPVGVELVTQHNIVYMMTLVQNMRVSIIEKRFPDFVRNFIHRMFRTSHSLNASETAKSDKPRNSVLGESAEVPTWVVDALQAAGIDLNFDNARQ
jgi:queuine tRNA-ribosyltransferase catalytic subunit